MSQGKITSKQQEILEYIKETILKKGYPPTVREICEAVQFTHIWKHWNAMDISGEILPSPELWRF